MKVKDFQDYVGNAVVTQPLERCVKAGGRTMELDEDEACQLELHGFSIKFRSPRHAKHPNTISVRKLDHHAVEGGHSGVVRLLCEASDTFTLQVAGTPVQRFRMLPPKQSADSIIAGIDELGLVRLWHSKGRIPRNSMREVFGTLLGASQAVMMGNLSLI